MIFKPQAHKILPILGTEPALPSLGRMVVTALKEAVTIIHHGVVNGQVFAEPEERARRKAICVQCEPHYRKSDGRCGHPNCGCKMVAKAAFDCMKCPDTPPKW